MESCPTLTKDFQRNIGEVTLNTSKYWYDVGKDVEYERIETAVKSYFKGCKDGFKAGKLNGFLIGLSISGIIYVISLVVKDRKLKEEE